MYKKNQAWEKLSFYHIGPNFPIFSGSYSPFTSHFKDKFSDIQISCVNTYYLNSSTQEELKSPRTTTQILVLPPTAEQKGTLESQKWHRF